MSDNKQPIIHVCQSSYGQFVEMQEQIKQLEKQNKIMYECLKKISNRQLIADYQFLAQETLALLSKKI